jgi:hypothetical protein
MGVVAPAKVEPATPIRVGQLAATDPIMSAASLMASRLLLMSVRRPREERLEWLRSELNKSQPGMGNEAVSKVRERRRSGASANQALFDGLRLALANFFAKRFSELQKKLPSAALSGLGTSQQDIQAVACLMMGTIGAGGATASSLMSNPSGSAAVGTAAQGVMTANSCNADTVRAQAELTAAQAALAAAQAGSGSIAVTADNTVLYAALGVGALVLLVGGVLVLKK